MSNSKMLEALNVQINKELYSAYLYLGMSSYFERVNLKGFAHWMQLQAKEEHTHAMKMYNFIHEVGGEVHLLSIEEPKQDWRSPLEIFKAAYEHEQKVTKMIHDLVALAIETKDYAANTFLQWFVTEQVEEEASASEIVQKLEFIGDVKPALLFLDAELGKRE